MSATTSPPDFDLPPKNAKGWRKRLNVERIEEIIDQRTLPGRELIAYRNDLLQDCGGADAVTSAQERLVEQAVITRALLEIASVWAVEHLRAGFGTDDKVLPWLIDLDRLQEREARLLKRLGLGQARERRPKTMKDLIREQGRQARMSDRPKSSEAPL